jgi:hypothetical protein
VRARRLHLGGTARAFAALAVVAGLVSGLAADAAPPPGPATVAVAPSPTHLPTPLPTPEPKVVRFSPGMSGGQLVAAIADASTDVIELAGGTYTPGSININVNRSRPVTIRPAPGATVVFANGTDAAFTFGYGGVAGNITIDGLIFDGYRIGSIGIVWIGNAHDITLNNITVRNSTGIGTNSWALYLSSDGGSGPTRVVADNWNVDGGARTLGGVQSYHNPNARGATLRGWHVRNCAYAIYLNSDATDVRIEDWTTTSCGVTTYADLSVVARDASGIIRNVRATDSGGVDIWPPMIESGNEW